MVSDDGRGFHDYHEGDKIVVRGNVYEIVGVDPADDGVRSYHLNGDTGMSARLDVHEDKGYFYLIAVGEVGLSDVSLKKASGGE